MPAGAKEPSSTSSSSPHRAGQARRPGTEEPTDEDEAAAAGTCGRPPSPAGSAVGHFAKPRSWAPSPVAAPSSRGRANAALPCHGFRAANGCRAADGRRPAPDFMWGVCDSSGNGLEFGSSRSIAVVLIRVETKPGEREEGKLQATHKNFLDSRTRASEVLPRHPKHRDRHRR
ncbi:unnamed protein product [Urochloa humidicola]